MITKEISPEEFRKRIKGKKLLFACCFCSKGINVIEDTDKRDDYATIEIKKTMQIFWCHIECLKKKITKNCREEMQGLK